MRLLVCGGRDFTDRDFAFSELDILNRNIGIDCIIDGAAPGADQLAHEWATIRQVMSERFPAEWRQLGRRAGPIRNGKMLKEGRPDCVLAFPGGRGTADMVRQARGAGVPVMFRTSPNDSVIPAAADTEPTAKA